MEQIVLEMYQAGNWNIEQVRSLVPSVISSEQFTQITGQPYEVQTSSTPSKNSTSQPTSPVTSQQVNQSNSTDKTSITN